ncbi:hypothetical protein KA005_83510, partial [bacterium]|nr:hypothetical protein [bacterium]
GSKEVLTISGISLSGDSEFSIISSPDLPFGVAAQTSYPIGIRFSPTSEGTKTASISITNNDLDENPYNITFIGSGSQGLYFSDFEADTSGEAPQTGGANQPSSYSVKNPTSASVLVQSAANGLSTQNVVITLDDPIDQGDWGTVDYAFGPYDSGIVCIEATVAINQLANLFFCATNVPSALITRLNTNFRDEIWGHSLMSEYQPNTPFRVRQYVNMDTNTWSAVIDDEMNGFDDDQMFTGIPFTQSVSQIGKFLAYNQYSSHGSAPVSIAYDDIFIKEVHFTPTGSLGTHRYHHTATLLDDGKVIIIGGNPGAELDTAELYDPASGTFSYTTGSLNKARRQHASVKLADGRILVCGGIGTGYITLSSAEIYDPSTGTFTSTGSLNTARYGHTATLLNIGKVLICGGRLGTTTFDSAEIYDPTTGTFTPTNIMSEPRYQHTATLLTAGKVLISGGLGSFQSPDSAEIYDPATGQFISTGNMSTKRYYHTATLLNNGNVFITGGIDGINALNSAEIYDPSTGTFSATGSMSVARMSHPATLLSNGNVLVCGGRSDASDVGTRHNSAELYNPVAGTFSPTDSMSVARDFFTAVLLNSGKVLVCGGLRENGTWLNSAELYDPWD